jgi:hypothetical protein
VTENGDDRADWLAFLREAEHDYDRANTTVARMWLSEYGLSEGVREAIERQRQANTRWEARLIAYNAFVDWQNR